MISFFKFLCKSPNWGSFTVETPTYDFTDFKPLTAEKFIENEVVFLKREYDKYPSILEKGYRIEVISSKLGDFISILFLSTLGYTAIEYLLHAFTGTYTYTLTTVFL